MLHLRVNGPSPRYASEVKAIIGRSIMDSEATDLEGANPAPLPPPKEREATNLIAANLAPRVVPRGEGVEGEEGKGRVNHVRGVSEARGDPKGYLYGCRWMKKRVLHFRHN